MCRKPMFDPMIRRLALGSPYSKPSTATAEDGLLRPASLRSSTGLYSVSIAAVIARCNATARLAGNRRLTLWRFTGRLRSFQHRDRAQDIRPAIAMVATNALQ
jgi:hypothetical protein